MKLKRLRIENFKRFRAPLELGNFADGLNLFVAPNEAGKSADFGDGDQSFRRT
ncbi:AAA family ATPase [Burkholderia vietnamiensis]|uniref:AAA family ATPase n=1 Tax=Burkholderia vietnamiensis TaxID=60552 RepID=UPI000AD4850C|nr:AAA family ATPase [Burkholderia vietnamiensis]